MLGSAALTVRRGITATPTPAPTSPCTVGLSFERNAQCGSIPSARNAATTWATAGLSRNPTSGCSATWCNVGRVRASRGIGCHDQHVRIAKQFDRLERRVADRQHHEPDVELAPLDRTDDLVVLELVEHHFDLRPLLREPTHQLRENTCADRLERADVERARFAGLQRTEVGLRRLQARDDRLRMPQ